MCTYCTYIIYICMIYVLDPNPGPEWRDECLWCIFTWQSFIKLCHSTHYNLQVLIPKCTCRLVSHSQTTPSIPPGGSGWLGMHCSIIRGQLIERTQTHLFHQAQQVPLPFASPSVLFQVSLQSEIVPSYHNDSCVILHSVRISIWNDVGSVCDV